MSLTVFISPDAGSLRNSQKPIEADAADTAAIQLMSPVGLTLCARYPFTSSTAAICTLDNLHRPLSKSFYVNDADLMATMGEMNFTNDMFSGWEPLPDSCRPAYPYHPGVDFTIYPHIPPPPFGPYYMKDYSRESAAYEEFLSTGSLPQNITARGPSK